MKSLQTLLFLLFSITLFSQGSTNSWYLAGSTGVGYGTNVSNSAINISSLYAHSFRAGYLIKDRILIGSNVSLSSFAFGGDPVRNVLQLQPFTRYYFSGNVPRKIRYFGEASFGTFSFFDVTDRFETNFHLGAGAEMSLLPGILGTVDLRYNANALGMNFTNLTFGFNVLTGQLENTGAVVSLTKGTLMARARVGNISIGRMSTNGLIDQRTNFGLSPWLGLFVSDRLMLEGGLGIFHASTRNETDGLNLEGRRSSSNSASTSLNLRYYLKQDGRLLPYLVAGGSFVFNNRQIRVGSVVDNSTTQQITANVGAGASYFFSPNLALDALVGYNRSRPLGQQVTGNIIIANASLEIGFRFVLPKC